MNGSTPTHFGLAEIVLVLTFAFLLDFFSIILAFIPFIDLLAIAISALGLGVLHTYFFFRMGPSGYFGGRRKYFKIATGLATAVVAAIPLLGALVFEIMFQAATMFYIAYLEYRDYAASQAGNA